MTLDYRATDREADAHAAVFCGVERLEESVLGLLVEAHPRVLYRQTDAIAVVAVGPDDELRRTILHGAHRFRSVQNQIQHDLLQLHTITTDTGKVIGELRPHDNHGPLKFVGRQRQHLSCRVIQIDSFRRTALLDEERAQACNDICCAIPIADRAPYRFTGALEIWRISAKHPEAGASIRNDARQRLVDFVRNRRSQRAERCDSGYTRELGSNFGERILRESTFRDVLNSTDVLQFAVLVSRRVLDD